MPFYSLAWSITTRKINMEEHSSRFYLFATTSGWTRLLRKLWLTSLRNKKLTWRRIGKFELSIFTLAWTSSLTKIIAPQPTFNARKNSTCSSATKLSISFQLYGKDVASKTKRIFQEACQVQDYKYLQEAHVWNKTNVLLLDQLGDHKHGVEKRLKNHKGTQRTHIHSATCLWILHSFNQDKRMQCMLLNHEFMVLFHKLMNNGF